MTQEQKIIKNKLGSLKLVHTLGSVSDARKAFGFSRDSCYRCFELAYHRQQTESALAA